MRTTLDIDDDVLAAAKELAADRKTTAGRVISDLLRQALTQPRTGERLVFRNGVPLLPPTLEPVTPEMIEKLLEEDF